MIPQTAVSLGWQLIAFNLFFLYFLPGRFLIHLIRNETNIPISRAIYPIAVYLIGLWGGISLIITTGGGMYVVIGTMLITIWLVIQHAFLVMTMSQDSTRESEP